MEKRVLIRRWLGPDAQSVPIYDEASVSTARQRVREAGSQLSLGAELVESVALIASELTHNQLAHARQGYLVVRPLEREEIKGLEVTAADLGPGIARPASAIQDQATPTSGSLGAGLSAVCRIADEVEFDNRLAEGTRIVARKFETAGATGPEVAIMGRPYPGEAISGDDAVFERFDGGFVAAVVDGLGHGPEAREASNRAVDTVRANLGLSLELLAAAVNDALIGTRGCAMSAIRFTRHDSMVEYFSAGDVQAHLYTFRSAHFFTPTPLVLGTGPLLRQRIRVEKTAMPGNSVLAIFTDGLKSQTTLKGQLDVLRQPAIAIAQRMIETYARPDDDALVLVVKFR
jgi:anti-sigma regulatory factor (Ser/Thr protein kinase)